MQYLAKSCVAVVYCVLRVHPQVRLIPGATQETIRDHINVTSLLAR